MRQGRRHRNSNAPFPIKFRWFAACFGVLIILLGVGALERGHLHYSNWYGEPVFAPFAIVFGLFMLFVAALGRKIGRGGPRSDGKHNAAGQLGR